MPSSIVRKPLIRTWEVAVPERPESVEACIDWIEFHYRQGSWVRGVSREVVAEAWGMTDLELSYLLKAARDRIEEEAPEKPLTPKERQQIIAGYMSRLEWTPKLAEKLSLTWGVAKNTVEHDAVNASRWFTANGDDARRDITQACRQAAQECLDTQRYKELARILEIYGRVSGVIDTRAPGVQVNVNAENITVTPIDAKRKMAALFGGVGPDTPALPSPVPTSVIDAPAEAFSE